MASNTVTTTTFTDDLDGSEAEGTITFALEGTTYEVDLSEANTVVLREALAPFIAGGRATSKPASKGKSKPNPETLKIRTWAQANGYEVADRGRVPAKVVEAYRVADATQAA